MLHSSGFEDWEKVNSAEKNSLKDLFSMHLAKRVEGTERKDEEDIGRTKLQL